MSRLTPFDSELFIMVESLTGNEPRITEDDYYYTMEVFHSSDDEREIRAINMAILGRIGDRIVGIEGDKYLIRYGEIKEEEERLTVERDTSVGERYLLKSKSVMALQVTEKNKNKLYIFTGGGTFTTPKRVGGIAHYTFVTPNGTLMDAKESDYILTDGERYEVASVGSFHALWDRDDVLEMMNEKYGKDLYYRAVKMEEEHSELRDAINEAYIGNGSIQNVIDELADVNILVYHIAGILGLTQSDLVEMAKTKIKRREKDPNYGR